MKLRTWLPLSLAALGTAVALALPRQDAQDEAMMQKWMEYMTQGEAHKALDHRAGKWDLTVKMTMAPGAPATESKATAEIRWILDGRYQADETHGSFEGMPFQGHGLMGYDNFKKKYFSAWIDNMGTGLTTNEGSYDPATKTFTFVGEGLDPMAGKLVRQRSVERVIDADHWQLQMFAPGPDGEEYMTMEIDYARAK